MAEPHKRVTRTSIPGAAPACVLCGEPTVGTLRDVHDVSAWPQEYPCCPACSYGVEDRELYALLRVTACGPS
jgi:hypothetical protein